MVTEISKSLLKMTTICSSSEQSCKFYHVLSERRGVIEIQWTRIWRWFAGEHYCRRHTVWEKQSHNPWQPRLNYMYSRVLSSVKIRPYSVPICVIIVFVGLLWSFTDLRCGCWQSDRRQNTSTDKRQFGKYMYMSVEQYGPYSCVEYLGLCRVLALASTRYSS